MEAGAHVRVCGFCVKYPAQITRESTDGFGARFYHRCAYCGTNGRSRQPAVLPPSALTPCVKNDQSKAQRVWQMGCYPYRTASASGGVPFRQVRPGRARKILRSSPIGARNSTGVGDPGYYNYAKWVLA